MSQNRECAVCGRGFQPTGRNQKSCSPDCAAARRKMRRYTVVRHRDPVTGEWQIVSESGERHPAAVALFGLAEQRAAIESVILRLRAFVAANRDHAEAPGVLREAEALAATIDRDADRLVSENRDAADFLAARSTYPWVDPNGGRSVMSKISAARDRVAQAREALAARKQQEQDLAEAERLVAEDDAAHAEAERQKAVAQAREEHDALAARYAESRDAGIAAAESYLVKRAEAAQDRDAMKHVAARIESLGEARPQAPGNALGTARADQALHDRLGFAYGAVLGFLDF